jgi:F-type H+-transporting ATPase subunit c
MDATSLSSIGAGIVTLGVGVGIGLVGMSAISGTARQPEIAPKLQTMMLICAALIEGIALFSLVICFLQMK